MARGVALGLLGVLYLLTRAPQATDSERELLASRFRFLAEELPRGTDEAPGTLRPVTPELRRIESWISAVGAAVALADLDGDGLANDFCQVDPRWDHVLVGPLPGTGARYELRTLDPAPLRYDTETMAPMGCVPGDLDEDGRLDVLVYYWGRTPIAFLATEGGDYEPREIVDSEERWFTNALTRADLDGDGHLDLVIGNYFADGSGIIGSGSVAGDASVMQSSMSRARNGGTKRFFLRDTTASTGFGYREVTPEWPDGIRTGWALGVGAADLDGDLLPELYFANDFGPDDFLHNRSTPGTLRFARLQAPEDATSPSSCILGRDSFKGMGIDFGDVDGDGHLDIYVSNIAEEYALLEAHFLFLGTGDPSAMARGIAPFRNASEQLGVARSSWGWESRLADFDNDGVLEMVQATGFVKGEIDRWPELQELATGNDLALRHVVSWPRFGPGDDLCGHAHNPFYVRSSTGRYVDLAADLGLDVPQVTRGIATADVDGDGDLDMVVANQWEASRFYRNDAPAAGRFLGLHLRHPLSSRTTSHQPGTPASLKIPTLAAVGATVELELPGGERRVAQVDGGNGHSGVRDTAVHIGLGDVDPDKTIRTRVRWRDPEGDTHESTFELKPGWHTIVLGWKNGRRVP